MTAGFVEIALIFVLPYLLLMAMASQAINAQARRLAFTASVGMLGILCAYFAITNGCTSDGTAYEECAWIGPSLAGAISAMQLPLMFLHIIVLVFVSLRASSMERSAKEGFGNGSGRNDS